MVGHDAPGFHQLIDAVAGKPKATPDEYWFERWHAADKYAKSLEARISRASFANETLAREVLRLLEEVREMNRELKKIYREREQA